MFTVEIETRVLGRRARVETRPITIDLPEGRHPMRVLIESVVRSEVAAFGKRMADRSMLQVLTEGAIATQVADGKVVPGGAGQAVGGQAVDERAAVDTAIVAHNDGLYQVVVDDKPIDSLDEVITVSPRTAVMFIRLVALRG